MRASHLVGKVFGYLSSLQDFGQSNRLCKQMFFKTVSANKTINPQEPYTKSTWESTVKNTQKVFYSPR